MKNSALFVTLFDSLYWARDQVLAAADGLTDEEYGRDNGFAEHSIRGALNHTLQAEIMYIARGLGETPPSPDSADAVTDTNNPSVASLKARWAEQEKVTRAFLATLTDEALDADIVFTRRDGVVVSQPLWHHMVSLYQHTLQHRSEAAEALSLIGRSPGGLDFPMYLAAKQA